jgi:hypothetical protein
MKIMHFGLKNGLFIIKSMGKCAFYMKNCMFYMKKCEFYMKKCRFLYEKTHVLYEKSCFFRRTMALACRHAEFLRILI